MRQRPNDPNMKTSLFVDAEPRPAGSTVRRKRRITKEEEFSEQRVLGLLVLAAVLISVSAFFVGGNHNNHLHRHVAKAYYGYVEEWESKYRAAWEGTEWWLLAESHDPLPLHRNAVAAKVAKLPSGKGDAKQTTVTSFEAERLIDTLFPLKALPLEDRHKALHMGLWRPVSRAMTTGLALKLKVRDKATGDESVIDLGTVPFHQQRSMYSGGEARCMRDQLGTWEEDYTCTVGEYLHALCYKVSKDASGHYVLDKTFGGEGCLPKQGSRPSSWGRINERSHKLNGRQYMTRLAENSTFLTVRHASDPALLEGYSIHEVEPNVSQSITFHALGMAAGFLGLMVLFPTFYFGLPAMRRRLRATTYKLRGKHLSKDSDDES